VAENYGGRQHEPERVKRVIPRIEFLPEFHPAPARRPTSRSAQPNRIVTLPTAVDVETF
jgi:hypothetical protein